MRRRILPICFICLLLLSVLGGCFVYAASLPEDLGRISSDAYIVMDAQTGQVLLEKNCDKVKYPASITKILTLALVLQYGNLDDTITVSREAVALPYDVSHIALQPGEVISVRDACMAALLPSANDAANCLAEYVSGSMEDFATLMNETAASLGCENTHFTNANGLPNNEHYTTAHDMALITQYALSVPGFRKLFATTEYTMAPTNKQRLERRWGTQNAMLVNSAFYCEGAWGGKLGWTEEARHTMVTVVNRDGDDLILVLLDSQTRDEKYYDALALMDYISQSFTFTSLSQKNTAELSIPITDNDSVLGSAIYTTDGIKLYLPTGISAEQLTYSWDAPQELAFGNYDDALLTVSMPMDDTEQAQVQLEIAPSGIDAAQDAYSVKIEAQNQIEQQSAATSAEGRKNAVLTAFLWSSAVLATLIFLAFCVRWYNIGRRNLRRYGKLFAPSSRRRRWEYRFSTKRI